VARGGVEPPTYRFSPLARVECSGPVRSDEPPGHEGAEARERQSEPSSIETRTETPAAPGVSGAQGCAKARGVRRRVTGQTTEPAGPASSVTPAVAKLARSARVAWPSGLAVPARWAASDSYSITATR
jgi:hypothetical protein